jgi:hypothetical protein
MKEMKVEYAEYPLKIAMMPMKIKEMVDFDSKVEG